ncbi:cytochrome C [Novosphingobium sp. PASSN1]|uniref:cytochrome C n=1 Tax=Novosphingobium sp. PASSN1 TaxID=2015561 RepID=UPI000BC60006|nr:cytochrome C [Novosphingobium sp. PASSN1]OYU35354.1 MAG: cytochrome C [Novosphingobium sp. PASSN1]
MKLRAGLIAAASLLGTLSLPALRAAEPDNHSPDIPAAVRPMMANPELAQSDFIEQCAGCHGVRGTTVPAHLPEIKDRVGWFMCTPGSRAYLLRLPNVAHSRLTDNAQLADLMNYVVFVLGGKSVPAGTKPFTGEEVAHERKFALTSVSLKAERLRLANESIRKCRAPASLRLQYPGSTQ